MNQPLVSIFIICYNQELYIEEALVSAVEQDYPNLEVVVIDDASKDATREIIKKVASNYPASRINIIFNETNLGITGNSNKGLKACKGELIAFMGGDDVLLPGKITKQVEWVLEDANRVLCGHDVKWIDQFGKELGLHSSDFVPCSAGAGAGGLIREGMPFAGSSIMIRRDRIPSYGFHSSMPNIADWMFWIDVVGEDGEYGYVEGVFAEYRRHSGNITAKLNWKILRDVLLTTFLSLWHFRGKYSLDWLRYYTRALRKRIPYCR